MSKLRTSQEEYPADLLANRLDLFLGQVPAAGIFLANRAILIKILHGIHATAATMTNMIILSVMGITVTGTILGAGNNPRFIRLIKDEVKTIQTRLAPTQPAAQVSPSTPVETKASSDPAKTTSPSETFTPTQVPTPTWLPTSTLTPPAVDIDPTKAPEIQPTQKPEIQPTKTPKDDNGNHFGQTKTPRPKKP